MEGIVLGKNSKKLVDLCGKLRFSQGFYGRLYSSLMELNQEDFDNLESELPDFTDDLSIIYYLEC